MCSRLRHSPTNAPPEASKHHAPQTKRRKTDESWRPAMTLMSCPGASTPSPPTSFFYRCSARYSIFLLQFHLHLLLPTHESLISPGSAWSSRTASSLDNPASYLAPARSVAALWRCGSGTGRRQVVTSATYRKQQQGRGRRTRLWKG